MITSTGPVGTMANDCNEISIYRLFFLQSVVLAGNTSKEMDDAG